MPARAEPSDVPIGIGLPMRDRITAELLAQNHRDDHRSFAVAGREPISATRTEPLGAVSVFSDVCLFQSGPHHTGSCGEGFGCGG